MNQIGERIVKFCPQNSFVSGFQVKKNWDDVLNGLKFVCKSPQNLNQSTITVFQGPQGTWAPELRISGDNQYFVKANMLGKTNGGRLYKGYSAIRLESAKYEPVSFQINSYDIPSNLIVQPKVLNQREILNCMNVTVKKTLAFQKEHQFYTDYKNDNGALFGTKVWAKMDVTEVTMGVEGKIEYKVEKILNFSFGKRNLNIRKYTDILQVDCPPLTRCFIQQQINEVIQKFIYRGVAIFPQGERMEMRGQLDGNLQSNSYDVVTRKAITIQQC